MIVEEPPLNLLQSLESRIAFQEDLLQKLDDALSGQQHQLLEMQRHIELLTQQIKILMQEIPDTPESPPPHY